MKCKKCKIDCIIDEWNGWVWACMECGSIKRKAHPHEIEKWDKQYSNFKKNLSQIQEK